MNKVDLNKSANLIILLDIFRSLINELIDLFVKLTDLLIFLCRSSIFINILEWFNLLDYLSYMFQYLLLHLLIILDPLYLYLS